MAARKEKTAEVMPMLKTVEQMSRISGIGENKLRELAEMAPVKGKGADGSGERVLPITEAARPYFERQLDLQVRQRELATNSGAAYYENNLVIAKPDGSPCRRERVSADFGQMLRRLELPHIRFHDLRHSAATNMHQLTGDFYTVGMVLGHSLKGMGIQLGISTNMEAMTAQYVDVRMERKQIVLDAYHNTLHPKKPAKETEQKTKKKSRDMER